MAVEVEILVHIAAPSTSKDDALYRTYASAYLDFHPARRIDLPTGLSKTAKPGPPPAELASPQASFSDVWDNNRPRRVQNYTQSSNSQNERDSQDSWVLPPSEVPDSMPNNDNRIKGFNSPSRILSVIQQGFESPSSDSSQEEAGRRIPTVDGGDRDLATLLFRGTDPTIRKEDHEPTNCEREPPPSHDTAYEGGADITTFLARGTDTIIHGDHWVATQLTEEPGPFRRTTDEASDKLNTLLARGTDSILQGVRGTPTPAAAETSLHVTRRGTPANAATGASRMDESHVSQTPSSPLRSKGSAPSPLPPDRASPASRPRSPTPLRTSQQSQTSGVTVPATPLPARADSAPPSAKRRKPSPLREPVHDLGRAGSAVLPRTAARASPSTTTTTAAPPPTLPPPPPQSIDWSRHTRLDAPAPAPSSDRLAPRVPPMLALLMQDIGGRFRPAFPPGGRTTMRAHERGYWLVPVADWPHEDRLRAWAFLGNYICRDQAAGWGTRACRGTSSASSASSAAAAAAAAADWAWIRLYGWEHLAGELYVLLYIASLRRLKAMDIAWYDGAGQVLLGVGARGEKSACWDRPRRLNAGVGILDCDVCDYGHDTPGVREERS